MKRNIIGNIIYKRRMQTGISQKDLIRGLMHERELSRIETGSKIPSKTQLDALFQRLGLSADRIENTLSYKEYQLLRFRQQIEWSIIKGEYELSESLIMQYKDMTYGNDPLEEQYILFMRTIIALDNAQVGTIDEVSSGLNLCHRKESVNALVKAIHMTYPTWDKGNYEFKFLCVQEIHIVSLLGFLLCKDNRKDIGKRILKNLLRYIEKEYMDPQEKAKVISQCSYF